jgi:hypothetical protein
VGGEVIVGRDGELSRLRALLARAAAGVGAVVLVEGEHVSRISAKLGMQSRAEIIREARRHPPSAGRSGPASVA